MNLPNKLTVVRIVLVPFFLAFLLLDIIPYNFLWALIMFAIASFTDFLDGNIARKQNIVTNFGKFMDPLADKVLVVSAIVAFIELSLTSSVAVIIIIAREFLVTSLRLIAVDNGIVIAASIYGKIKTVTQMISISGILLLLAINDVTPLSIDIPLISNILMWICAAITLVSGIEYLIKNKDCIVTDK